MRSYDFTIARDGETFAATYVADDCEAAEALALADVNRAWRNGYPDYMEMTADCDGSTMIEHDTVMADPIPVDTLALYRLLSDGIADMVDNGRLTEADCPDDFAWLAGILASIAAADPRDAAVAPDTITETADADQCGQCEGTGTISGGLSGDGDDEQCPVCDGSGTLDHDDQ